MGAGDFLKVAAGQVRQASMTLKQEAQGMLNERENTARQKSSSITQAQSRLKAKEIELHDPSKDDRAKQEVAKEVAKLQQEIADERREMQEVTQRLADEAGRKQALAQQLDGRASELDSQSSAV